jgi:PKD repeat protein
MAEEAAAPRSSKIPGWLKALGTTIFGLLSGAAIAYVSPLVDKAVKPAKPLANFQCDANGLQITIQNRCTGASEGLWDFGDSSALQPFVPDQTTVTHKYSKAGPYTVKLTVRNFVGDEHERTVSVSVDEANTAPPTIETFDVVPVHPDCYAPASFRVTSSVKNADVCAWSLGSKPMQFATDVGKGKQHQLVRFEEPGTYVIKLAAFNGKSAEAFKVVEVRKPPVGTLMASLTVTYNAVHVEEKVTAPFMMQEWNPAVKGATCPFSRPIFDAEQGYEFVQASFAQPVKDQVVRNPQLQISPDRKKLLWSGELVKQGNALPNWTVQLQITQQKRSAAAAKAMDPVTVNLAAPGSTTIPLPPLPAGWTASGHSIALALTQDGKQAAWNNGQLPQNVPVQMAKSLFLINSVEQDNQVRVDVSTVSATFVPLGN